MSDIEMPGGAVNSISWTCDDGRHGERSHYAAFADEWGNPIGEIVKFSHRKNADSFARELKIQFDLDRAIQETY
jgi:hypothetical protein